MSDSGIEPSQAAGSSLTQSVKALVAVLTAALHTRLELFTTELQEELERAKQTLALFLILLCAVSVGFVLLNIFLVALFWHNGWIAAIGILALIYFALGALAAFKLRGATLRPGGLFPMTLAELAKDRDQLRAAAREP